jgi:hypothetical protein
MIHLDPLWFEAAGADAAAIKIGVDMLGNHKKDAAPAPAATTPTALASSISTTDYWMGVLILAAAMIAAALIVRSGLVA